MSQPTSIQMLDGDSRIVGSEARFIDGQRPAIKRFGFRKPVGGMAPLTHADDVLGPHEGWIRYLPARHSAAD